MMPSEEIIFNSEERLSPRSAFDAEEDNYLKYNERFKKNSSQNF